ncbi:DUF1707 domain-containing protein [Kribbella sp. NPDC059898]|uniref:DUF1707 domain-containing protein n=1 Tax=Kribbella sp. NPDC059898 TaxID=3346995 RepID=UPI00365E00FE
MSPADRDRRRRGGPAGRRRRDWQGGPTWDEAWNGWFDDPGTRSRRHNWGGDWHARGWSGDWRATAWSNPANENNPQNGADSSWNGQPAGGTQNTGGSWNEQSAGGTQNAGGSSNEQSAGGTQNAGGSSNEQSAGGTQNVGGSWSGPSAGGAPDAGGSWDGLVSGVGSSTDGRTLGGGSTQRDVPSKRVRVGDAERDQAVAMLSEHFVAGRLTQEEFEERSERATKARYADEFEALFDELPRSGALQPVQVGPPVRRHGPPPAFLMIAPFLMIGLVISSVALTAPWLLWGVFWIVMLSGISRRRWQH